MTQELDQERRDAMRGYAGNLTLLLGGTYGVKVIAQCLESLVARFLDTTEAVVRERLYGEQEAAGDVHVDVPASKLERDPTDLEELLFRVHALEAEVSLLRQLSTLQSLEVKVGEIHGMVTRMLSGGLQITIRKQEAAAEVGLQP